MYAVSIAGESILKYLKDLLGTVSGKTQQEGIKDIHGPTFWEGGAWRSPSTFSICRPLSRSKSFLPKLTF